MNHLRALREIVIARFIPPLASVHGLGHWTRVERIGGYLADRTPGADAQVVQLFALLHDSCRRDDSDDPDHGPRACDMTEDFHHSGFLPKLTPEQLDTLLTAIGMHTAGDTTSDPTIGVCWDADRLDLARLDIRPDPEYLSTEAAKDEDIIERSMRLEW